MESTVKNSISVNIPNYSGPLEVLLDLAKQQKVDLAQISITKLADEFLIYIKKESDRLNLEIASEFLLMATWLAYLKSKLLLPEDEDDDFKALEVAEKLKLQLKKLELIRLLSDQMLKKNRIGVNAYIWASSLIVLQSMPLSHIDPISGVIYTDWYKYKTSSNKEYKVYVYVMEDTLTPDALNVKVFTRELLLVLI